MDQSTHVHHPNDYNYHSAHERRSNSARKPSRWYRIRRVTTWQQIFQIGVASASFVAGAGVGREVLHDPLATAEGVLNFPIVVSQVAVILTEAFLVGERIYRWDPFAVVSLIEHISILGVAFALFSQLGLGLLFELQHFPHSVHNITSYGGAALLHFGFILVHTVQAAVLKWPILYPYLQKNILIFRGILGAELPLFQGSEAEQAAYLKKQGWNPGGHMVALTEELRDAIQQSREILRSYSVYDPLQGYDLNTCDSISREQLSHVTETKDLESHHHCHGFAAIIADIIAHSVSVPTFSVAWLLVTLGVHISDLGVAWTAELTTLLLLGCIIQISIQQSMSAWRRIEAKPQGKISTELRQELTTFLIPKYSRFIQNVDFSLRQVPTRTSNLLYVTFDVSAFYSHWHEFTISANGSPSAKDEAEQDLRRLAVKFRAFDFSRLQPHDNTEEGKMVRWMFSTMPSRSEFLQLPTFEKLDETA